MLLPTTYRKVIHVVLFILIIAFQVGLYYFWKEQKDNKEKLSSAIEKLQKPNDVMRYTNQATSYYFEADNYFAKYLQDYDKETLEEYKNSLKKLSSVLDTLQQITVNESDLSGVVESKADVAMQIVSIKKKLDSLIDGGLKPIKIYSPDVNSALENLKTYNASNALRSITYDTIITKPEEVKKKGLLKRIGKAISGDEEVKKEKVEIRITMKVGKENSSGSFAEQIERLASDINKYYKNSFKDVQDKYKEQLRSTYYKLQNKDKEAIKLNENILNGSKSIISFYSSAASELDQIRQKKLIVQYNKDIEKQGEIVKKLLVGMGVATLILLFYTIIAQVYENKLQKAKKIAEQNDELKTRVLGMLSHEMRAPLNIISNKSLKVRENVSSPTAIKDIDSILFSSNSLNLTVNQILEYIKKENSDLTLNNINLFLYDEVEAIVNSLQTLADMKKLQLNLNADDSTKQIVWADSVKIHQLFYNLVGNSIKFTDKGSITIHTKVEEQEDNRLKFFTSIVDTGEGIPKDEIPYIFDQYFQSKTHKDAKLGMGLGLSLCKEIIERYDGEVSIDSEVGKGTTISFYMYFNSPQLSQATSKGILKEDIFTNKKVAIVDDDVFIRKVTKKLLEDVDFEVIEFDSAQKMINYLGENKVDLIITDIQLPEISGFDLAEKVKKSRNTQNTKTPILAITGDYTMNVDRVQKHQIDDFLTKPINQEEFYTKIINLLQK
ncbi:MAG: response regulator [Flavobacteriales bacterium]|nr:response regulator [Flavobacteriales bacterium]